MSERPWSPKGVTEVKDYSFDWTAILGAGDSISTSDWTTTDLTATLSLKSTAGNVTLVWVAGGTDKKLTLLTNVITTVNGRTYTRTRPLEVRNP